MICEPKLYVNPILKLFIIAKRNLFECIVSIFLKLI